MCFLCVQVFAQSTIRWCTISDAEHRKCEAMSQALAEASIRPAVSCVSGVTVEGCVQKLEVGFGLHLNVMFKELRSHSKFTPYLIAQR